MTYQTTRSTPFWSGPTIGPVTKGLLIAISAATLLFTFMDGRLGLPFGARNLVFSVEAILQLELWRLVTFPFVETDLNGGFAPLSLMISLAVLYFFGRSLEAQWGSKHFLRFFILSSFGAGVLAVPISLLFRLIPIFRDVGFGSGPSAAFDAMLVALAVSLPNANILFGFIIPMRTRTAIYLILGMQLVLGIMTGVTNVSMTLGGMAMGYVLATGIWRPERLWARLRLWRLRQRRRGLYVVPPGNRTLH